MRRLAAVALLTIPAACQAPPTEMTEAEIAQIEAEVMATSDRLIDSWNAYDAEAFFGVYHPEKVSFAWGARVWKDHEALSDGWREVWSSGDSISVSWVERTVQVLDDEAAIFQGSTDLTVYYKNGRIMHYPGTAHWTGLFEPAADGWKMTVSSYTFGGAQRLDQQG